MACFVAGNEDSPVPQVYEDLVRPHVASFDFFLEEGLEQVVESVEPIVVEHSETKLVYKFWFENPTVSSPNRDDPKCSDQRLLPKDCREGGMTYKAPFEADLVCSSSSGTYRITKRLGSIPIMVKSKRCYLRHATRKDLVKLGEEANEAGGYFICNGIERIIRCLIATRRHYIMALRRGAYHKRGANYTDCATLIRCVRPDQSSATVRCHYLTDGAVNFAFTMRRSEYFIPAGILLKCLMEVSDRELYSKLMTCAPTGSAHAAFVAERAEILLQQPNKLGLLTRARCLEYLGRHFKLVLDLPPTTPDIRAGEVLLERYVFIHLDSSQNADKLNLLIQMLLKLYALVNSACCEDNADALTHHEVMLPGHLLCKFMKERLEDCLILFKEHVMKELKKSPGAVQLQDEGYLRKAADKMPDLGKKMEYLLNTGNLVSKSGLDLQQTNGFTVVAEKLNVFRFLSHFRSVHRGAYFAQMRTTTVRKLLPESWGFMCPVHTPDGAPCGLLNHFTAACQIITHEPDDPSLVHSSLCQLLIALGTIPSAPSTTPPPVPDYLPVVLDGRVVGSLRASLISAVVTRLRQIKAAVLANELDEDYNSDDDTADGTDDDMTTPAGHPANPARPPRRPRTIALDPLERNVPSNLEIAHIPFANGGPYPGLFLFTQSSRLSRPVLQLPSGAKEIIGTLEQLHLDIRCPDSGAGGSPGIPFSHSEVNAGQLLSVVASMTPYSDYNQSPRNMYQCQMAKQTMGTPTQAFGHRTDGKMYRIQNPQTPIARTSKYKQYNIDEYPNGANAVVAVLAYTGYDMEDAMILNKSSVERGFAHATLYKTEIIDLKDDRGGNGKSMFAPQPTPPEKPFVRAAKEVGAFGQRFPQNLPSGAESEAVQNLGVRAESHHKDSDRIDVDGLPHVGAIIWPKQSYCSHVDTVSKRYSGHKLKGEEVGVVDQVTVVGPGSMQRAVIKMRLNRNPMIGDKFASRHGQKGVLSIRWPDVDMPYAPKTGMRPDLIINPHAFPSRMTIGMLVESLVSKGGALEGRFVDASPFQRADGKLENPTAVFGEILEQHGFARHGQETMISGITGEEMPCDIYVGLVYYQRLRHMVSDKFQVRSTGAINQLTRQPIKGRKFGGGIRFGEMERDSLLAHGAAYLLHDRLHSCSDYHVLDVCTKCGSLVAPINKPVAGSSATKPAGLMAGVDGSRGAGGDGMVVCPVCSNSSGSVERVAMPYVFKYLATELAAMNIKTVVEVQ